jgi:GNAT superfamily N-acetyltransferase
LAAEPKSAAVRTARPSDVGALSALAESTFRETYGRFNTSADMDAYCLQHHTPEVIGKEIVTPGVEFIVCEHDAELIAFAQLVRNATTHHLVARRPMEVHRFYVAAPWIGRGISQLLVADLKARAKQGGADYLWLGVWEKNLRAIAFYQKSGFGVVGRQTFKLGADIQNDLVFALPISGSSA